MKILSLLREYYTPDTTIGRLFLADNSFFCYTLEDTCRAYAIKVKGHTAIPVTTGTMYKVEVNYSQRFQKELPIIYTEKGKDGNYILSNGITFTAVRFHGGNDNKDTEGCVLVAYNYDGYDKIQGRSDDDLTAKIKEYLKGDTVGLMIKNMPNKLT